MKNNSYLSYFWILCPFLLGALGLVSCGGENNEMQAKPAKTEVIIESAALEEEEEKKKPEFYFSYRLDSIATMEELDSFQTKFSEEEKKMIFALNRMDAWRLKVGNKIVIPDSLPVNFLDLSPFPKKMGILDSIPKSVLIAQRIQAFALYEGEDLVFWGPVSSGKRSTPTPNGLHYGNHKAKKKVSTVNPDWLLPYYFNFMNFEGVGVHEYAMPGYPASHACVRLRKEDAQFIYDWAEQWELNHNEQEVLKNGTPFMVFGEYDFEGNVPWFKLAEDNRSNFLNAEEQDILKNYVKRYNEDHRNFREIKEQDLIFPPGEEGLEGVP